MDSSYLNPDEFGSAPVRPGWRGWHNDRAKRMSKRTIDAPTEEYYRNFDALRAMMESTPGTAEPVSQLGDELLKRDEMG
jgi:hypothetical protein